MSSKTVPAKPTHDVDSPETEKPTLLHFHDADQSTEDYFATPNEGSRATSLKPVNSKDTSKAASSQDAPVKSTEPLPDAAIANKAPPNSGEHGIEESTTPKDTLKNEGLNVSEVDGPEKSNAGDDGTEKQGSAASKEDGTVEKNTSDEATKVEALSVGEEDGIEEKNVPNITTQDQAPTTHEEDGTEEKNVPNGATENQSLSNGEADPSEEHSKLGKEIDLEAGEGVSTSGKKENSGAMAEEAISDIVDWDGPDDPQNARNWSPILKNGNIAVMSAITFLTPLASSMLAPGVPEVMKEFKSDNIELASFVVSVFVLGYAFGPLVIAPLSEIYGRLPLYHIGNVGFVVFTVACALSKNLNMLIGFRFLEGLFGATPLTIGGGTIADMIVQEKRGGVIAIWALGPLLGPAIGPIAGGFLANSVNWRWIFWVIAIAGGVMGILGLIFFRETYPPVLLERKAKRLRKETGNPNLKSKLASNLAYKDYFRLAIERPAKLLIGSPIVLATSIYVAVIYSYLYLLFTTITEVYEGLYHFSPGIVGLTYLGIGVGCFLGVAIFGVASDRILKHMSAKGEMKPEYRLPPLIPGSFFVPIGLFIYGWTTHFHTHWIAPIIGTSLVGIGLVAISMPIQTYLVDTFTIYAASAVAANIFLRSLLGALLPLAGRQLYITLGLGWGNSLLAFVALACCPIPIIFFKYGERIRKNKRWNITL